MNKISPYIKTFALVVLIPLLAFGNFDILDNIGAAIRSGDSKQVSRYFDNNVELTILDRESTYSRTQAEMVLKDFFTKYPVQSFELIHRGTSGEGSAYGIGKMKTPSQSFRVYFFVKQKGSQSLLQEIRFEKGQ